MDFKGFDDWVEIFKGGKQIDSQGREHDGNALIDKAIETFDPKFHEPPAVVGHPKNNAPAYGWVQELKRSGNLLLAKFKDAVPEFEAAVKNGMYKKRSAGFYPDGRLRHVGFLGAAPPAVKGLADLSFKADEDQILFEFEDYKISVVGRILQNLRDFIIEKFGTETADKVISNWEIEDLKQQPGKEAEPLFSDKSKEDNMGDTVEQLQDKLDAQKTEFSEKFSTLEAKIEKAKEAGKKEAEVEFAEKQREAQREARAKDISAWCDSMVKEKKLTPALIKYGVPEILGFMAESDDIIEFGESKDKATLYDRFKGLFETELPKLIEFKEIAGRGSDVSGGDAAGKLVLLIRKKQNANKDLSYSAAFSEVQGENPDLVLEYQQEMTE